MLTRSPVPPRSANASPSFHSFHYAPSHSPRQSPSRVSTTRSWSPSSLSSSAVASPSRIRAKYRYVDASTQYSPMEPGSRPGNTQQVPSTQPTPTEPPPTPVPKPMEPGIEQGVMPTSTSRQTVPTTASSSRGPQPVASPQKTSPNKRRNSQGPGHGHDGPSSVNSPSVLAKRPKADSGPPKILPRKYETCPMDDIVVLVANMLNELIETNDSWAMKSGHLTRFHSRTAPGISVLDYLHRLTKHATLTQPLLVSMVYYIDLLCSAYSDFTINTLTVHRFLITAATVAAKGLSDSFWNNSTYARIGGVRLAELKLLETEFLYRVDWRIVPQPEVLESYYKGLIERCPQYVLEGEESAVVDDDDDEEDNDDDDDDEEEDDDDLEDDYSEEDDEEDNTTGVRKASAPQAKANG